VIVTQEDVPVRSNITSTTTIDLKGLKPGANLEEIISPPRNIISKLTKKDVLVIWGGTRDIGKNKANKALNQITKFVHSHKQTNVIVISARHRSDLRAHSCVNKEVSVYNNKLRKLLKPCDNARILGDSRRESFTRHGLHMNKNGKERMAKK